MINRIFKSFKNKFSRFLLLLSIISGLIITIFFSFFIKDYSNILINEINGQLDIKVSLKSDFSQYNTGYYSQIHDLDGNIVSDYETWLNIYNIYKEDYEELSSKEYVKYSDLNIINSNLLGLSPYNGKELLTSVKNETNIQCLSCAISDYDMLNYGNSINGSYLSSISKEDNSFKRYKDYDYLFEGRDFTNEEIDNGSYKIILDGIYYSYDGETSKKISVGDTFYYSLLSKPNDIYNEIGEVINTYEFEVIGITYIYNRYSSATFKLNYNLIPQKAFEQIILDNIEYIKDDLLYTLEDGTKIFSSPINFYSTTFELNSLNDLEQFVNDINKLNSEGRTYTYKTNANKYIELAGSLDATSELFNTIYIFSLVSSLLVVFLIVILDMFQRKSEIGILCSLGETKLRICVQIILEYLIIIIVSYILCLFIINFSFNTLITNILDTSNLNNISKITSNEILNGKNLLITLALSIGIILPGIIFTASYMLHFNPKEILNDE